jgi:hypothetical protein
LHSIASFVVEPEAADPALSGLIYLKIAELLRSVKSRQQASAMQIKIGSRRLFVFVGVWQAASGLSVCPTARSRAPEGDGSAQRFGVRQLIRTCGETP